MINRSRELRANGVQLVQERVAIIRNASSTNCDDLCLESI